MASEGVASKEVILHNGGAILRRFRERGKCELKVPVFSVVAWTADAPFELLAVR